MRPFVPALCVLVLPFVAVAAENVVLNHHGRLLTAGDVGVTEQQALTIGLFTDAFNPNDPAAWSETYDVKPAPGGLYAVAIGDTANGKKALPASVFGEHPTLFLGVTVGSTPLMPRFAVTRVPAAGHALVAAEAQHADVAATALGLDCEGCVKSAHLDPAWVAAIDAATLGGAPAVKAPTPNAVPLLDANGLVAPAFLGQVDATTLRGAAPSTEATAGALVALDATGHVSKAQLPVLDAATLGGAAPATYALKTDVPTLVPASGLFTVSTAKDRLGLLNATPRAVLDIGGAADVVTALDIATGGCATANTVTLSGTPDLSKVAVNDVFVDEARNAFTVTGVNTAAKTLTFTGTCVEDGSNDAFVTRPGLAVGGNVGIGMASPQARLSVSPGNNLMPIIQANQITFDSAQGQGLANMVGGARFAFDVPQKGEVARAQHLYLGTRGVSRLGLHDGALYLDVGGASGVANAVVNWETMIFAGNSSAPLPTLAIASGGCATAGTVQLAATSDLSTALYGDLFYDAAGVSFVVLGIDNTTKKLTIGASGLGSGANLCTETGTATPKIQRNAVGIPNTYLGIGNSTPLSPVDVSGSAIRIRTAFTPTNTADVRGNVGDISWDNGYVYVKTSAGWKRSALTTF